MNANNRTAESRRSEPHGATADRAARPVLFVVDDDLGTQELLRDVARGYGWELHAFTRLADVRESLSWVKPTLLILDDDLPDGRGGDLARELREADIPVLVCTAADSSRVEEIGEWAPVVSKPFDVIEIEAYLAPARRRRERQSDGRAAT